MYYLGFIAINVFVKRNVVPSSKTLLPNPYIFSTWNSKLTIWPDITHSLKYQGSSSIQLQWYRDFRKLVFVIIEELLKRLYSRLSLRIHSLHFKLFSPVHLIFCTDPPFCRTVRDKFSPMNLHKGQTSTKALLYCTVPLASWTKRRQVKLQCIVTIIDKVNMIKYIL